MLLNGPRQFQDHLKGKFHRKRLRRLLRKKRLKGMGTDHTEPPQGPAPQLTADLVGNNDGDKLIQVNKRRWDGNDGHSFIQLVVSPGASPTTWLSLGPDI